MTDILHFPPVNGKSRMKQLTPYRRELMLKVLHGEQTLVPVLFKWNFKEGVEDVLRYCVMTGMVGSALSHWLFTVYGRNFHEPFAYLLEKADKELPKSSPILVR